MESNKNSRSNSLEIDSQNISVGKIQNELYSPYNPSQLTPIQIQFSSPKKIKISEVLFNENKLEISVFPNNFGKFLAKNHINFLKSDEKSSENSNIEFPLLEKRDSPIYKKLIFGKSYFNFKSPKKNCSIEDNFSPFSPLYESEKSLKADSLFKAAFEFPKKNVGTKLLKNQDISGKYQLLLEPSSDLNNFWKTLLIVNDKDIRKSFQTPSKQFEFLQKNSNLTSVNKKNTHFKFDKFEKENSLKKSNFKSKLGLNASPFLVQNQSCQNNIKDKTNSNLIDKNKTVQKILTPSKPNYNEKLDTSFFSKSNKNLKFSKSKSKTTQKKKNCKSPNKNCKLKYCDYYLPRGVGQETFSRLNCAKTGAIQKLKQDTLQKTLQNAKSINFHGGITGSRVQSTVCTFARTECLKSYCVCYREGKICSEGCQCFGCVNQSSIKFIFAENMENRAKKEAKVNILKEMIAKLEAYNKISTKNSCKK